MIQVLLKEYINRNETKIKAKCLLPVVAGEQPDPAFYFVL